MRRSRHTLATSPRGPRDAEGVDVRRRGRAHAHRHRPPPHLRIDQDPRFRREQLGVAHPRHAHVGREDDRRSHHRTGERTPPDLVHAGHPLNLLLPPVALVAERILEAKAAAGQGHGLKLGRSIRPVEAERFGEAVPLVRSLLQRWRGSNCPAIPRYRVGDRRRSARMSGIVSRGTHMPRAIRSWFDTLTDVRREEVRALVLMIL